MTEPDLPQPAPVPQDWPRVTVIAAESEPDPLDAFVWFASAAGEPWVP